MLQSAAARSQIDQAIILIRHIPHQLRCRIRDLQEILLESTLLDPVRRRQREIIAPPRVLERGRIMIPQQERRIIERIEIRRHETRASLLGRQQPARHLRPALRQGETHRHRMLQIAVQVHVHPRRRNERKLLCHKARRHTALRRQHPPGRVHRPVGGHAHLPVIQAFLAPGKRLPGRIHRREITQMLGIIHHLIITRRPPRQIQRHHPVLRHRAHAKIQIHQQITPLRIHPHAVRHLIPRLPHRTTHAQQPHQKQRTKRHI